jgi:hypothetical protein
MFGKIVIVNNELMKIKGHLNPKNLKKKKKKKKRELFYLTFIWIKAWNKNLIPGMWCNLGNGKMSFVDVSVLILGLTRPKSNDRGNPMP